MKMDWFWSLNPTRTSFRTNQLINKSVTSLLGVVFLSETRTNLDPTSRTRTSLRQRTRVLEKTLLAQRAGRRSWKVERKEKLQRLVNLWLLYQDGLQSEPLDQLQSDGSRKQTESQNWTAT